MKPGHFEPFFVSASLPYGRVHVTITTSHPTIGNLRNLHTVCGRPLTHMCLRPSAPVPHTEVCRACLRKLGARQPNQTQES